MNENMNILSYLLYSHSSYVIQNYHIIKVSINHKLCVKNSAVLRSSQRLRNIFCNFSLVYKVKQKDVQLFPISRSLLLLKYFWHIFGYTKAVNWFFLIVLFPVLLEAFKYSRRFVCWVLGKEKRLLIKQVFQCTNFFEQFNVRLAFKVAASFIYFFIYC